MLQSNTAYVYEYNVWLVSNSMCLENMNENYFRLKTSAISVTRRKTKIKNDRTKRKQNQENDDATLAKAKENRGEK